MRKGERRTNDEGVEEGGGRRRKGNKMYKTEEG